MNLELICPTWYRRSVNSQPQSVKRTSWNVVHQDDARPRVSIVTRQRSVELEWDVPAHLPCSFDLARSDYRLFCSLQNYLDDKNLPPLGDWKRQFERFFSSED